MVDLAFFDPLADAAGSSSFLFFRLSFCRSCRWRLISFCFSDGRSLKATLVEAVELVESEEILVWFAEVDWVEVEVDQVGAFRIRDLMLAPSFKVEIDEVELAVDDVSGEAVDACA